MKRHPDQFDGELYMGNIDYDGFKRSSWVTKRMGHVAYDVDGKVIPHYDGFHPWFIRASEVEQAAKVAEASDGPGSAERAAVYRDMLNDRV